MTARKALKKVVRERMSRTGETYSTALRQVAGKRQPSAGRPGESKPPSHHESVLVQHLLAAAGLPLSEPMVCGLGGGIGFMYAVFDYDIVPHPLLTIVAQHHPQPWAPAVLDRLGIGYRQQHGSSAKAAMSKLGAVLDSGRPALCTVDRGPLPWHQRSGFDGAEPHTVVVTPGDQDATLTVLDPPFGEHELATGDFVTAWTSHKPGRHHLLAVTETEVAGPASLEAPIRDALATTVAHLTGPVLGNSFDVNFGFSGMAKLTAELRDDRSRKGWVKRFAQPAGHAHAMRRLVECLEQQYTAPAATRPLYADFLLEAAATLVQAAPNLGQAAELFRASGRSWSALAQSAAAAGPEPPDQAGMREWCDRAAELVGASLAAEQSAVESLSAPAITAGAGE